MTRCGQIAATMPAVRAPQSKPATTALSIFSASIRAMTSVASAPCWPLRGVSAERKRRAVAAQPGRDHPEACRRQHRDDIDEGVDVVGPAVQEDDDGTIGGPGFGITDSEDAGLDLFQRGKRGVGARPDCARAGLLRRRTAQRGRRSWRTVPPQAPRRRCRGSGVGQGWWATWISLRFSI